MFPKPKPVIAAIGGAFVLQIALMAWSPASGSLAQSVLLGGSRDAIAAPQAGPRITGSLDVAVERCSQPPSGGVEYAQHAYPGMNAAQLSQVRGLGHVEQKGATNYLAGLPDYPFAGADGYVQGTATVYVRDGMVGVLCGPPGGRWFDTITFTLVE